MIKERIIHWGSTIVWEIITDASFEGQDRYISVAEATLPPFVEPDNGLFDTYKWLHKIGE